MEEKKSLDDRISKMSEEVFFCKRCVNSNQRFGLTFDEKGVCDACQFADLKDNEIDWGKREDELRVLLDKYRSKDGKYDVIVPGSGGKDSAYVAHKLKYKYGMNPLCLTWAPAMYTDIGWQNLQSFIRSGFDVNLMFPDPKLHSKLAMLGLELMGDPFLPWHYGVRSFPLRIAIQFDIPLVFYGENGRAEYGSGKDLWYKSGENLDYWKNYYSNLYKSVDVYIEEGIRRGLIKESDISSSLELYKLPSFENLEQLQIDMKWFSYYKKWIPQENYYYATENCGFKPNSKRTEGTYSKYASLDDKMDGIHYYMQFIKIGIGRCTSEASQEIRSKLINREEGVALVHKYDGECPHEYFRECLEYMDITEERFWEIVDRFRPPHLWKEEDGNWKLKYRVS